MLKEEPFSVFVAVSEGDITSLWEMSSRLTAHLNKRTQLSQGKERLGDFLQSHYKVSHYMFSVNKCGNTEHSI